MKLDSFILKAKNFKLTNVDRILIICLFIYVQTYQFRIFFEPGVIRNVGIALKIIIPVIFLLLGIPLLLKRLPGKIMCYFLLQLVFYILIYVSTAENYGISHSLVRGSRPIFLLIFLFGCFFFFSYKPTRIIFLLKIYINLCVLVTILQFLFIYIGIFPSIRSAVRFTLHPGIFPRLYGWWLEPSNASGVMYASMWISFKFRQLFPKEKIKYTLFMFICLVGGVVTLSNAGYIALGGSSYLFVLMQTKFKVKYKILILSLALFLVVMGFLGRKIIYDRYRNNTKMTTIVGLRGANLKDGQNTDFSDGRLALLKKEFDVASSKLFGDGLGDSHDDDRNKSPMAWSFWMGRLGFIGIIIKLSAMFILFLCIKKICKLFHLGLACSCAWITIVIQQAVYGNWLGSIYFLFASSILALYYFGNNLNKHLISLNVGKS